MQLLAALAERLLERRARPRDEAVERGGDVEDDLAHDLRSLGRRPRSAPAVLGLGRSRVRALPQEQPAERRRREREDRADEEREVVAAG